MTLQELQDRLAEATGADRELDALIWYVLIEKPQPGDKRDRDMVGRWDAYTASIDAVIALVERKLPGANCHGYEKTPHGCTGWVSRNNVESGHWMVERDAPTPALALLKALIAALIAQEKRS